MEAPFGGGRPFYVFHSAAQRMSQSNSRSAAVGRSARLIAEDDKLLLAQWRRRRGRRPLLQCFQTLPKVKLLEKKAHQCPF